MATKAQVYATLADDTARKITGDYLDWAAFLDTSSRLYKYPFHDQLLIYAQRPDATACAEYDIWNDTMRRYIRRGSKGIALLSPGPGGMSVRYVFDVSDTGERRGSRRVEPWVLAEGNMEPVKQMLENAYYADASMPLSGQIGQIATQQALAYWREHRRDIIDSVDGSYLSEYDEFNIGASFRKAAAASISHSLQARCGLEPELFREDFTEVLDWNTPATVAELGKAVSEISGQVLRQIEKTIRQVERSMEHERTDLQEERGLSAARPGSDRSGTQAAGQVRGDAAALPGGEPSGPVYEAAPQRQPDDAPSGDRGDGPEPSGQPDEPSDEGSGRDGGTQSPESDGVGGPDEQLQGASGRDDPVGADLRLTDYEPQQEQLSFIFPTESEQIQIIDSMEAESIGMMPFASLVSQEVVDEFLRVGGNSDDLRLVIGTAIMKQLSTESVADYMCRSFHGGNGLKVDGRQYSAWYDEDGIHFSLGKSARYVTMAQTLSWEDAAKRVGELMESGQYMSMMELAAAPAHERAALSQSLWYMYSETAPEAQGFFPSIEAIHGGGFPEETSRLADRLADPQFLSTLTAEVERFAGAYEDNHDLMRFHYHRPEQVLQALKELTLPRREYDSLLTEVSRPDGFITEDELGAFLSSGSSMEGGKDRIYRYFTDIPAHSTKEKADFLKCEYGIGGRSHALSRSDGSSESHDSKGIKLTKKGCPEVHLNWNEAAKRIDRLVSLHRYLTPEEKAQFQQSAQRNSLFDTYKVVKESHPDDMVLFQVGEFYELYGEDARTAASMLGLTLTSRLVPGAGRVDMCGIPAHQLEQYVEQLRDKYDVTISAVDWDSQERRVSSRPSIDHEAERDIDAYEAEFGADGTRVFGSSTIRTEDTSTPSRTEITQADIDAAIQEWNGDTSSKRAVVRRLREGASRADMLHVLREEYGDDLPSFPVNGVSGAGDIPWEEILDRVLNLIEEDRFFTAEEQDALEDIDPVYIRERLAESGIEGGKVVDQEKFAQNPFIRQVEQTVAQIIQEEAELEESEQSQGTSPTVREVYEQFLPIVKSLVLEDEAYQNACKNSDRENAYLEGEAAIKRVVATIQDARFIDLYYGLDNFHNRLHSDIIQATYPELSQPLPDLTEQPTVQAPAYQVGDTVYLEDGKPFIIERISPLGIELRDPSLTYPILRAESQESFARLMERYPQPQKQPEITSETVAVYPAKQNGLPYDIVIERMHTAPQKERPEQSTTQNFRITDNHLGEGGAKTKFGYNIAAIRTLKQIEAEGRTATPDEQEVLSRYVGWGGLADAFDASKPAWTDEYRQLAAILTPQEYEAARASTLNSHYTSPTVIQAIYDAVGNMGFTSGNILEPSMGVGNFFGMLPEAMQSSRLYGVELDGITGRIAQQLYPKANITVAGFETTDRRDFFDIAIGNVPFGNYKVNDRAYNKLGFSIHNYFFAKAIDQVRPGGVIAFVTSRYTLDQQSPEVRKYIAQRAELLGAIRLPNNAFRANAGTDVVSDIIFLQKRDHPIDIEPDWVHLGQNEDGFSINSYFVDHPEMILGIQSRENTQYGRQDFTVLPVEGASLADQLHEAIQHIHGNYQEAALPDLGENEAIDESIPADPNVRNFSYAVVDGQVYYRENSRMVRPSLNQTAQERVKGMVELRDQVHRLIDAQLDEHSDEEIAVMQQELNQTYDAYSAKYGLINDRANRLAFSDDSSYYLLCSLEILDEEHRLKGKADMFTKRTIRQRHSIDHADTASDALAVSIGERAKVDLPFMSRLTGKDEKQLAEELTGVIYRIPGTDAQYVTADEYLSGNVRQKLREAKLAAQSDASFQTNVTALTAAQPKDLEASEIDVRLGATWISPDYIQDFMYELLNTPYYQRRAIDVHFSPHTAEWRINGKTVVSRSNVAAYASYGTDRANAYKLLEDALNLRDTRIFDTIQNADGKEQRVLNQKATTLAQQKQQAIKDAFREWIWKQPTRRETLVKEYNERFNSIRPRAYDGQHIVFSGMNPEITLREHQRSAVAHILYGGNTLLAHQVGAGKTFEMVAAAMESKRLGLSQKSMFVVPNHLTEQWASEFLRLYPSARILVTTKKDFETSNRKKFCARIATGDYDAVIIGHSQFEKIPVSHERQEQLLQDQIDEIMMGITELKESNGERFSIKQLEKSKKQLETKLQKLKAEERKDDVVTFEQLGVDRLYVDEAHSYKNLFLYTKMRNVAGISATEAQKSSDMFMKCRYMDQLTGGRGVIFATGTPVSNSMTELYTMQRYLQYAALQRSGMTHFDAWASTFGETATAIELAPEGTGYRARTRFSKFFNLPELMNVFKEVADIKTADQLHLPTPEAHYETIAVKPSPQQQELVQALSERAAAVHQKLVDPSEDNMLKITGDGRKLGLDQRLINPLLPDDPDSKVNACVRNIFRIWDESKGQRLTQLVFCDISTPKPVSGDQMSEFNVYDDIRAKLIAQGVPKEEIAFIHDADTEVKKKELFAKVRSGQVRVLMGSTAKMGAGTNVQDRLIAQHDLDCPWRPGDLEQRAGRIVRQGNRNEKVFIYRYVTEATFDAYLWQTVENKQKFISQIMTSKSPVRSCDDMDETALSYAEIKALCAGDPRIKEKMDLDVDVARLKLMKADHLSKQYRLEDQLLKDFPQEIERDTQLIAGFEKDIATIEAHPLPQEDFVGMMVGGKLILDKEEAGKAILAACKEAAKGMDAEFGSYRGLTMSISYDSFINKFQLILHGSVSHRMDVGNDARGNITRLDNTIAQIPKRMEETAARLAAVRQQVADAKEEAGKPFPQEDELKTKSARLAELNAALDIDKTTATKQQEKPRRGEER